MFDPPKLERSFETLSNDKDYYGNKKLELAGHLLDLLFQDLFKGGIDTDQKFRFSVPTFWKQNFRVLESDVICKVKKEVDKTLSKKARAGPLDLSNYVKNNFDSNDLSLKAEAGFLYPKRSNPSKPKTIGRKGYHNGPNKSNLHGELGPQTFQDGARGYHAGPLTAVIQQDL